jgi:hypothetical protein
MEVVTHKSFKLVGRPSKLALPIPQIQVQIHPVVTTMGELWLLAAKQSNQVKQLPSMVSRFQSLQVAEILSWEEVRLLLLLLGAVPTTLLRSSILAALPSSSLKHQEEMESL